MTNHTTPLDTPLKRCSKCGQEKPATLEFFWSDRRASDGLHCWCKECARAYRTANREHIREQKKKYRAANRERIADYDRARSVENRERKAQQNRAYRAANRERISERERLHYASIRERKAKNYRIWYEANRDRVIARNRRRRARKNGAEGTHTVADVQEQYERQKGRCYWCGEKVGDTYHVDHVVPLSRGGSDGPENLVIACPFCNISKKDKLPHEWPQGGRLL